MNSCDLLLLIDLMQGIDYDDAVLCTGLNNQLFMSNYADKQLFMLQGRGILFVDDLLKRLHINHEILTIDELLQFDKNLLNQVLIILPHIDFDKIQHFQKNVVQFINLYSSYTVTSINDGEIVLRGVEEDEFITKRLSLRDFYHLSNTKIKPLYVSQRIVYIRDTFVPQEMITECLANNLRELLVDDTYFDEKGGWTRGISFYDAVKDKLIEGWDDDFNKVSKFVFFQSMLNGSSFFYRREFSNALKNKYLVDEEIINLLYQSGNLWRKLGRYLRGLVVENKPLDKLFIEHTLTDIKNIETYTFNKMITNMTIKV
ncbi:MULTISPECIES: hypothetical protein [Paenibacillus]|uniref:Uncharacterized protein n=1 Tax=Paenibacillus azoreducens TaxID=116718 RepID=A0A919YH33_9BACL|nr:MULTISPECIES: hypothetical protein [Paenibacillus]MBE9915101.1 hypothetical protein [Paenibacillus donghaensis]GIO49203.1 hypothetical protein J34TS1_39680 [Paenibacillus azoreducens]